MFSSLKAHWIKECPYFYSENVGKVINCQNFMAVFAKAWVKGMTITNVVSCFKSVGVYPLDRRVAVTPIAQESEISQQNTPSLCALLHTTKRCCQCYPTQYSTHRCHNTACHLHSCRGGAFSGMPSGVRRLQVCVVAVPDPHYALWLQDIGINPAGAHSTMPPSDEASTATPDDASRSPCQTGDCGHPRARLWIACDQCQRWYHCLCAGVSLKKAKSASYRPTHALLAPRHAIDHLHNHVNAHSLAFSMLDRRRPFYPCPNIMYPRLPV